MAEVINPNAQNNTGAAGSKGTEESQQPAGQAAASTLLESGDEGKPDEKKEEKPGEKKEEKPGEKQEEKPGEKKEEKPDDKKKEESAPEKYEDFTAPEGVQLDTEIVGKFTGLAKEFNLSQGNAQKLVDLATEHHQRIIQTQLDRWNEISSEWQAKLKADKEFGGEKFNETVQRAKRALNKFGSNDEDLMTVIKPVSKGGMGLGNHPGVIRLLARFDKATSEDAIVDGGESGKDNRSAADVLYPNQGKAK